MAAASSIDVTFLAWKYLGHRAALSTDYLRLHESQSEFRRNDVS